MNVGKPDIGSLIFLNQKCYKPIDIRTEKRIYCNHGNRRETRYLIKEAFGKRGLNTIDPKDSKDGIEITRDELFQYHKFRIMFESGKRLTRAEEISLALDLSEDFIQFCISKGAISEIREALRQKGITQLKP